MTDDTLAIVERLDRLAHALTVPAERKLWGVEEITAYYGYDSDSSTYRNLVCKPDFPAAVIASGKVRKWVAGEVMDWAESHRERRGRKVA